MDWLEILTLGAIQGLTEFLPISSDGHLTIAQHAFAAIRGTSRTGSENLFIDVMLHIGTLCAILAHYWRVILRGARGLLAGETRHSSPGSTSGPNPDEPPRVQVGASEEDLPYRRSMVVRVLALAIVATLPAVPVGLLLKKQLEKTLEGTAWSGAGFLVTAAVLLLATRLKGGDKGPSRTTWVDALLVGVAQAFAPLPGVSRSGLTIATALGLGFSRTWAVQFSLLMAVPVISGAAVLELRKFHLGSLSPDRITQIVAASVLAGLVGYGAIVWLVRVVRSGRIWYFSVYLIFLGTIVLGWSLLKGGTPVVRHARALDGPGWGGGAGAVADRDGGGRPFGPLDRPDAPGPRSGSSRARAQAPGRPGAEGLGLGRPLARGARPA